MKRKINLTKTITDYLSKVLGITLHLDVSIRTDDFVIYNNSWYPENTQSIINYMKKIGFELINSGDYIAVFSNKNLNNLINMLKLKNEITYLPTNYL